MAYVENTLMDNEKVLMLTNPHKVVLLPSIVAFMLTIVFSILASRLPLLSTPIYSTVSFYTIVITVMLCYAVIKLLHGIICYRTSEYAITNMRVVMKRGVINRVALELMLNRLEAVKVKQSLLGQMFNYGTVELVGVGGTNDAFEYVPKPMYFRQKIQTLRDQDMESAQ